MIKNFLRAFLLVVISSFLLVGCDIGFGDTSDSGNNSIDSSFVPSVYAVKFYYGNDLLEEKEYEFGYSLEALTLEKMPGLTFIRWYSDANLTKPASFPIKVRSDLNFYAKFLGEPFTITYIYNDANNGATAVNKTVFYNETYGTLPTPSKFGFDFLGWYLDSNFTSPLETSTIVKILADQNVYARWSAPVEYAIHFETNGAPTIEDISFTYEYPTFDLPIPTYLGYTFLGWYRTINFIGLPVTQIISGTHENITLYAKWQIITYTITYNLNGGKGINSETYTVVTPTFELQIPTKFGYTFLGWYVNSEFTEPSVTTIEIGTIGDKEYYAKFSEPIIYSITYHLNGGLGLENAQLTILDLPYSLQIPTKDGYSFLGWYEDASFNGDSIETLNSNNVRSLELYAKWVRLEYNIVYITNGGKGVINSTYNVETPTFDLAIPNRDGYSFLGWFDNIELDGEVVTQIAVGSFGNKTFYASWSEPIEYTITYVTNGGILNVYTATYTVLTGNIVLPIPSRDGYDFAGWYDNIEFNGTPNPQLASGSTGNRTFYAKWSPINYVIRLHDGTDITVISYNSDSPDYLLPVLAKDGYLFQGWHYSSIFDDDPVEYVYSGSYGNLDLFASWLLL